jgi:hypothetical protein
MINPKENKVIQKRKSYQLPICESDVNGICIVHIIHAYI